MSPQQFSSWLLTPHRRPLVMGILNVTPDSFSDGGQFTDSSAAIDRGLQMLAEGADILDIGGESTRPGSARVDSPEQIRRTIPVIQGLARQAPGLISIDTTRSDVARAALDAGASLLNDISAGLDDPGILTLAAGRACPIVLMHMQGQPASMQANPVYRNVVQEVREFLRDRAAAAMARGVAPHNILLDPGIGFGKNPDHNLALLRHLSQLADLGHPIVLGTSRKGFIGTITGEAKPADRLFGTAATIAWGVANRAAILRVHDVAPMCRVIRMICAIQGSGNE